jgi:cellulose biosynthesis protein BcsQ
MRIVAFYNLKGGVGKTSCAVNIAYLATQSHLPTLLWDLDPQGGASWLLGTDENSPHWSPKKLLRGKAVIGDQVVNTPYEHLQLIPADFSERDFDLALARFADDNDALKRLIDPFGETHSLAVLDCPPSLSRLALQVFAAADIVFVPLVPTHLSLRAFHQVREYMKEHGLGHKNLYPFFNMVDVRRKLHRDIVETPPKELKRLLLSYIPYASEVEKMGVHRAPLPVYARTHPATIAFRNLWQDILAQIY